MFFFCKKLELNVNQDIPEYLHNLNDDARRHVAQVLKSFQHAIKLYHISIYSVQKFKTKLYRSECVNMLTMTFNCTNNFCVVEVFFS